MAATQLHLRGLFIRRCAAFSGHALLLYDYLITLPLEYIWNAPWTPVKAGFLVNRYGNLIGHTFFVLEETGYLSQSSVEFCDSFRLFFTLFIIFSAESIRILVLMRAWAIWGCRYGVAVFSIALYVLFILAVIATIIYTQTHVKTVPYPYLSRFGVCVSPMPPYIWLIWLAALVLDTVVLAMIWHSLRKFLKDSNRIYPSPLVRLLVHDAILFYAASVFNSVFSIACWTMYRNDPRYILQLALSFPFLSAIGQRLVLNLRGFQRQPLTTRDISREVNRQIAAMGDLLWQDLGPNEGSANEEGSDSGKGTATAPDPDYELVEIQVA